MLHAKQQVQSYGSGETDATDAGPKLTELLKTCTSPKMLFVIVVTFLCGWESALIDVFFNVHLSNIGAPVRSVHPSSGIRENTDVGTISPAVLPSLRFRVVRFEPMTDPVRTSSTKLGAALMHVGRLDGYSAAVDLLGALR